MTVTQLWPPTIPSTFVRGRVTSTWAAEGIPSVGRAVMLHQLAAIMALELWRGSTLLPTPRILTQPDPQRPGATWLVQQCVRDWLLEGNALCKITARDSEGQPAAWRWAPASRWSIEDDGLSGVESYKLNGHPVPWHDVIHVQRGADPDYPARGIGIVEQYVRTLNVSTMQLDSEAENLKTGGVPSVAVITPQADPTQDDADKAGAAWERAFQGPGRRPGIFPKDTQVIPLSWSATDAQMIEARNMNTADVANLTGLDKYWLNVDAGSHNYKSPGPMWLTLLKTPLEGMLQLFEDALSDRLTPRGQRIRFRRSDLTSDDLETSIRTMAAAKLAGLYSHEEARTYLGLDPAGGDPKLGAGAPAPAPVPVPDTGGVPA